MKVELFRSRTRAFIKGYNEGHTTDPEDFFNKGLVFSVLVMLKTCPSDVKAEFLVNA